MTSQRRLAALAAQLAPSPCATSAVTLSAEVAAALAAGRPVVALESTIISHGMPFPQNLETALAVEAAIRARGAVPATVAVLSGVCHVGLTAEQLAQLAKLGRAAVKTSRRDLPLVLARRLTGATTVSGTMLLAHAAGIDVFVTGGVGGVHRGGESSLDVSADLLELGRTPVCVVCAGVKSILDIPRTLEVLETQGVPVAAWQSDDFPAFYTRRSGCRAPARLDSAAEAAAAVAAAQRLGLAGMLLAVPIPADAEADGAAIEAATAQALDEATAQSVVGAAITPFVLQRVAELTQGASLRANIALILHNARVGADVALALAALRRTR